MLIIPAGIWHGLMADLASSAQDREQVAYLDGVRSGPANAILNSPGTVTTVVRPSAQSRAGDFAVSAEAMSAAGQHLRTHGLARLAQVHTHPSEWVDHSAWDDTHAYSQQHGAISLVLPDYGRNPIGPAEGGVHLRDESGWTRLDPRAAARLIRLVPSTIDLRSAPWLSETVTSSASGPTGATTPRHRWWSPSPWTRRARR